MKLRLSTVPPLRRDPDHRIAAQCPVPLSREGRVRMVVGDVISMAD